MKKQLLTFLVLLCSCLKVIAQGGDKCTLKGSLKSGICKIITDCPTAVEEAKLGIEQTLCGYADDLITAIVCCEEKRIVDDNLDKQQQKRISQEKCEEYNRPVTAVVGVLPLISDAVPITIKNPKCDYNVKPLIVGGEPAEPGEFPFMALVGFNATSEPWRCGGTLISNRFIVTAAHCTFTTDAGKPTVVRLGELDLSSENDGSQYKDYPLRRIIIHPNYSPPSKYNDIALLETRDEVIFTRFIRPACLNLNSDIQNGKAIATGWGRTDFAADNSEKLMKVTLNVYTNERCKTTFPSDVSLPRGIASSMVCAGDLKGGKDTCYGDSGGPLVVTKTGNMCYFYLIGITSFGKLCGFSNTPAIYTRVSEYIPWIENIVW
ncbi:venom protease-like isoform X1 [Diorhabda sublineata]|uniref:venom protease-like isoform X1 n=1 Tax=Diorhabda sublineata TaxID=1163346 RepID=UPI0024E09393|nr:venom protease-like isoform X1 [Diorhabda sublineata]